MQGERKCSGRFEIQSLDHYVPTSSESEFDDDDDDDDDITLMDTQSESEAESGDRVLLQPMPRQQLIMPKPLRRFSSSSCSEALKADESFLARDSSQSESESIHSLTKTRGYSVDLGRITAGTNISSGGRASSRSTDSRSLEGVAKKAVNDYVPFTALDQRRYVSSLFQPASPLVGENMKVRKFVFFPQLLTISHAILSLFLSPSSYLSHILSPFPFKLLLNMNAYRGLTEYQKRKLRSLLPSVDRGGIEGYVYTITLTYTHVRVYIYPVTMAFPLHPAHTYMYSSPGSSISESSFSNAFFSSALREWQEHVALGSFTPEYKAKMRGEEKRRTAARAEELWKQKFYEENWGDK